MFEQCKAEIEELHRFFVAWMTGACAKDAASYDRVRSVLAPDFVIISPNGVTTRCEPLLDELYAAHARRADDPGFAIWIKQATQRWSGNGHALLAYEEWQSAEGSQTARISTALFEAAPDAPCGVRWRHLQETWKG